MFYMSEILLSPKYTQKTFHMSEVLLLPEHSEEVYMSEVLLLPAHTEDIVHVRSPTFASLELVQEVKQWHGVLNEHGWSSVSGRLQDGSHGCAVSRVQFDQSLGQQQSNDVGPVTSIYRYA